jgi:hypothetical protein
VVPGAPNVSVAPPSLPGAPVRMVAGGAVTEPHVVAVYKAPGRRQIAQELTAAGLPSVGVGVGSVGARDTAEPSLSAALPAPRETARPRPTTSGDDADFGI